MNYKFTVLFLILISGWGVSVSAQQTATKTEIKFSVYSTQPSQMGRIHYMTPQQNPRLLSFSAGGSIEKYEYVGPETITFFDYIGNPGSDDFQMIPKATARIPSNVNDAVFFFLPNHEGSNLPYRVYVFNNTERAFPYQSAVVFNMSGRSLLMNQGNRMVSIGAGPMAPLGIRNGQGVFQFYYEVGSRRVRIFDRTIRCGEHERLIIVILPPRNPKTTEVPIYILRELRPKEDQQPVNPQGETTSSQ